jgi:hypothetical protein
MPARERLDRRTLAGPRRHAPDLGLHRDRDLWCATGSPDLLRRGGSRRPRAWPWAGATASLASRGGTPAAGREQRWGFAGRREKQEAGLTPDRAGWPGHADGAPHIWPVIKKGGLSARTKAPYPAEQSRPFPVKQRSHTPKKTNPDSQKRRALPPPAGEDHVPPSRGELYPAEWRRAKPGRRQAPYPCMRGGPDLRQPGKDHTPPRKVASRPQWVGGHLRLPRSGLRRWPVQPTPLAGIKESGRAGSPPSCRP